MMRFIMRRGRRVAARLGLAGCAVAAALLTVTAQSGPVPAVGMIEPGGAANGYWPRWRGPSGQGVVQGTGYPDTWSDSTNVAWKTEVPGRGHSSPIVWGESIFLTTAYDDGRVAVLSFRRTDGRLSWEAVGPDRTQEYTHEKNSNASPTPTTDGRRIYASFGNKGIMAVDFAGRVVWHRSLGTFDNYHGTAGSPLLYKDRLITFQDHTGGSSGGAFITALDLETGRSLWRTDRRGSVGWSTPIAIRAGDHDEIVVSSQREVQAYDPETGRELWRCGGNLYEVIPTPVAGHGLVFCSSGRAGPTLAIRPGGTGDVSGTHVVWTSPRGSPFVPSPLLYGGHLYLINDMASIVTCLEAATGNVVWQGRLGEARREGFSASPVAVDGKVFFTNDDGETFVLRSGPQFELLRVNPLNARTLASPALAGGRWYFRTDRELVAIGK
jgi:outer membrane protein assembly factor BamB